MKKQISKYILVALIGFLLGGCFFVNYQQDAASLTEKTASVKTASAASSNAASAADIVKEVGPAVVYVEAKKSGNQLSQRYFTWPPLGQQEETATGTGFIIDSEGYILTNQHVVDGASSIQVKLEGREEAVEAQVVGQDYDLDLAIIKIQESNLPTIPMGDSDVMRPGDPVIAIGNPLGLDHTVTAGVISAKGRPITVEDRNYKNLIQTDAAINPGNSGGPLINMQGEVIAINTAVSTEAQGIGFAIPINTAKDKLQELIENGQVTRSYLGISMVDITPALAQQLNISSDTEGVVIANVSAESPASNAGIKKLDVLVSIDGKPVENGSTVQDYIQQQKVGQTVTLGLLRNQTSLQVSVTLKQEPANYHNPS